MRKMKILMSAGKDAQFYTEAVEGAGAYWNGKYIEAYEHTSLPIFGVQWHPERTCFSQARSDTVCGAKIFEYFISLCEKHSKK